MSYFNFTPYGPGLTPTDISQVSNDNFYRMQRVISNITDSGGWTADTLPNISTVTYNGNRSYDITFSGDVSKLLSPGMRLKTVNQIAAPTQCTSLNGTNQSWSKTGTITGLATGTTWTFKVKAKINSYKTQVLVAFDDGATNILQIYLNSLGQVVVGGGTYASQDTVTSSASHPLNKWFEVTGSITIGSSPSGEVTIDGYSIPVTIGNGAVTTFTAASTTLYVGRNAGGNYVDGKISQASVFNAIISATTLRSYYSQTQAGNETNCIGFWSFNGNGNDSSSNANNLTANNSATATNADSFFALDSYGTPTGTDNISLVQKVSSTVATVQVPAGCTIPTTGGIAATYISTVKNPYNWVTDNERWELAAYSLNYMFTPTSATWYNLNSLKISMPVGNWNLGYSMYNLRGTATWTTSSYVIAASVLSVTSASAGSSYEQQRWSANNQYDGYATGSVAATCNGPVDKYANINVTSTTTYYLNYYMATGGTVYSASANNGCNGPFTIRALPSGL